MSSRRLIGQPQFRRIFLAQSVSTLGDNIAPVAIAFAVLGSLHSSVDLGFVLAGRTLALAVFVLVGGAWADRLPRKSLMVVSDLVRMTTQALFAIVLIAHVPSVATMVVLQIVNGAATAFFRPASSGLLQEAVSAEDRQAANSYLSATTNISSIVGPALAAALLAVGGNAWALGVDAASFAISALFLIGIVVPAREPQVRTGLFHEISLGFQAITQRRWLGYQIAGFAQFQLCVLATYAVLGPLIAEKHYGGASTWAAVASLSGIGALVGNLVAARLRFRRPLVAANLITLGSLPLLLALAWQAPVAVLLGAAFLFGVAINVPDTLWFTALQDNVPVHLMSRVSSFDWMGSTVLRPVGLAIVAPLAAICGPEVLLLVASGLTLATLVGLISNPSVRHLRKGVE